MRYTDSPQALKDILAKHYPRKLSSQLSCQYNSTLLQARFASGGLGMRGAAVTVAEHFDGTAELLWRDQGLTYTVHQRTRRAPPGLSRKDVDISTLPLQ